MHDQPAACVATSACTHARGRESDERPAGDHVASSSSSPWKPVRTGRIASSSHQRNVPSSSSARGGSLPIRPISCCRVLDALRHANNKRLTCRVSMRLNGLHKFSLRSTCACVCGVQTASVYRRRLGPDEPSRTGASSGSAELAGFLCRWASTFVSLLCGSHEMVVLHDWPV
jgi:hypothetical protein